MASLLSGAAGVGATGTSDSASDTKENKGQKEGAQEEGGEHAEQVAFLDETNSARTHTSGRSGSGSGSSLGYGLSFMMGVLVSTGAKWLLDAHDQVRRKRAILGPLLDDR